jgi:hypothetical protein
MSVRVHGGIKTRETSVAVLGNEVLSPAHGH